MKRRGGVGHDLSHIRPKGTPVKNSALTSTGIVPFMERYSNSTREVAQDGRRGALMLSVSIKHPDSQDFMDAKLEKGKVTGANVSVKITDDFMGSLINNKPFIQQYPIDSSTPTTVKEVDASKLWKKIIHNSWKSAEPGVLFWDKIISESIPDLYYKYGFRTKSTNPCLTSDSMIMTDNGEISIKEIVDNFDVNKYKVLTYNEKTKETEYNFVADALLSKRNANIIELELEDGNTIKLTPDHKVFTENRGWIEASMLTKNDILLEIED
jgi:ribonucleotide reductase alpha subunit